MLYSSQPSASLLSSLRSCERVVGPSRVIGVPLQLQHDVACGLPAIVGIFARHRVTMRSRPGAASGWTSDMAVDRYGGSRQSDSQVLLP